MAPVEKPRSSEATQTPADRQYEPPTLKKMGQLTRVINMSGFITVSGGRSD